MFKKFVSILFIVSIFVVGTFIPVQAIDNSKEPLTVTTVEEERTIITQFFQSENYMLYDEYDNAGNLIQHRVFNFNPDYAMYLYSSLPVVFEASGTGVGYAIIDNNTTAYKCSDGAWENGRFSKHTITLSNIEAGRFGTKFIDLVDDIIDLEYDISSSYGQIVLDSIIFVIVLYLGDPSLSFSALINGLGVGVSAANQAKKLEDKVEKADDCYERLLF